MTLLILVEMMTYRRTTDFQIKTVTVLPRGGDA